MAEDNDHKKFNEWLHDPGKGFCMIQGKDGLMHKVKAIEFVKEVPDGIEVKAILEDEPFTTETQTKICPICHGMKWYDHNFHGLIPCFKCTK